MKPRDPGPHPWRRLRPRHRAVLALLDEGGGAVSAENDFEAVLAAATDHPAGLASWRGAWMVAPADRRCQHLHPNGTRCCLHRRPDDTLCGVHARQAIGGWPPPRPGSRRAVVRAGLRARYGGAS